MCTILHESRNCRFPPLLYYNLQNLIQNKRDRTMQMKVRLFTQESRADLIFCFPPFCSPESPAKLHTKSPTMISTPCSAPPHSKFEACVDQRASRLPGVDPPQLAAQRVTCTWVDQVAQSTVRTYRCFRDSLQTAYDVQCHVDGLH